MPEECRTAVGVTEVVHKVNSYVEKKASLQSDVEVDAETASMMQSVLEDAAQSSQHVVMGNTSLSRRTVPVLPPSLPSGDIAVAGLPAGQQLPPPPKVNAVLLQVRKVHTEFDRKKRDWLKTLNDAKNTA